MTDRIDTESVKAQLPHISSVCGDIDALVLDLLDDRDKWKERARIERERKDAVVRQHKVTVAKWKERAEHLQTSLNTLRVLTSTERELELEARIEQAEQEVAKLHGLTARTAAHWLGIDPPIPWEGAIDSAMEAAAGEIASLREKVRELEAERDRLRGLLREHFAEDIAETTPPGPER